MLGGAIGVLLAERTLGLSAPPCPTHAVFGFECPGCGAGRSINALFDGDVGRAFSYNVLVPIALVLVVAAVVTPRARVGRLLQRRYGAVAVGVVVGAFWLARLLPWSGFDWLRANH